MHPLKEPLRSSRRYVEWCLRSAFCSHSIQEVVFVVGPPRSGTSMMQNFIGAHSSFFSIEGETAFFRPSRDWPNLDRWVPEFTKKHPAYAPGSAVRAFDAFIDGLRVQTGALDKIFVEKTPQHTKSIGFLYRHFANAKFVHVVRDPRDSFLSALSHPIMTQKSGSRYFRYWRKCVTDRLRLGSASRIIDLKYEDFCQNPLTEGRRLMQWLGHEAEEQQWHFYERKDLRADLGHFAKLGKPIDTASIGRFRTELSATDKSMANDIIGKEMRQLGYAVD